MSFVEDSALHYSANVPFGLSNGMAPKKREDCSWPAVQEKVSDSSIVTLQSLIRTVSRFELINVNTDYFASSMKLIITLHP